MAARLANIFDFYREGFRSMRLGRLLWKIILLKLALIYVLAKFWLPDYLRTHYATDEARAAHVLDELTRADIGTAEAELRPGAVERSLGKGHSGGLAVAPGFTPRRE